MKTSDFLALCAAVFSLGYLAVRIYHDTHPIQETVEAEQERDRSVIACIGQHHPSEPEDYQTVDDPVFALVHDITRATR